LVKRAFYGRPNIARDYDHQRFGGPSGTRVNQRELEIVESQLPGSGRVLDLACGTGRLAHRLAAGGYQLVAADASLPMLQEMLNGPEPSPVIRRPPSVVVADAFRLPFIDGAFDAAVAMRLLFHYADVGPILREMARVCRHDGVVVFDTVSWSPRSVMALAPGRWGGKVFVHRPDVLASHLAELGLQVISRQYAFLLSPHLYRLLPLSLEMVLERLESSLPTTWRSRIIWQVQRARKLGTVRGPAHASPDT
jgi:SAM-dependent methyltransferase